MCCRTHFASLTTSKPSTRAVPEVGISSVISILIVVVLPAPFGPSRPNSSPFSISKLTPRTASISFARRRMVPVWVRYVRWRSCASTTAMAETLARGFAESSSAGGLDSDEVARIESLRRIGGQLLAVPEVAPGLAGLAAGRTAGGMPPPLGDDREAARLEHLELAHEPVAAAVAAVAA